MLKLVPPLAAAAVRALGITLRITDQGAEALEPLWAERRPLIYAVWHGRILMVPWLNVRLRRTRGARLARVLASRSRDGELVARWVRWPPRCGPVRTWRWCPMDRVVRPSACSPAWWRWPR